MAESRNAVSAPTKRKLASFFAGVGGIDLGFEQTGKFSVVYANEFDKNAQITYKENFSNDLDIRDIHDVKDHEIKYDVNVIAGGFPCQAFSIAGYRKGFEDERGDLFFELLRIINGKKPEAIFIENVKNMVTHDHGNTFKVIREALTENGYFIKWKVLNGKDYGNVPQNRERIYIVGFRNKVAFDNFSFPSKIKLSTELKSVINFDEEVDDKYYYREGRQPFYDQLVPAITNQNTVYQWRRQYVRENKSGVVPTLTANMGTGGHNVPLVLTKKGIRKLTPREAFNAQGYPSNYHLPQIANSQLYKQAGNSVVVPVIKRIAESISQALDDATNLAEVFASEVGAGYFARIHVKLNSQFEGESYLLSSHDTLLSVEEATTLDNQLLISDEEYLRLIKRGSKREFQMACALFD